MKNSSVIALSVAVLFGIGPAFATSVNSSAVFCINKKTGVTKLVDRVVVKGCTSAERKVLLSFSGATGATGSQGIQGLQGLIGPQGIQGLEGQQGETGPKGEKGDRGQTGLQGAQGVAGEQGEAGPAGDGLKVVDSDGKRVGFLVRMTLNQGDGRFATATIWDPELDFIFEMQRDGTILPVNQLHYATTDCTGPGFLLGQIESGRPVPIGIPNEGVKWFTTSGASSAPVVVRSYTSSTENWVCEEASNFNWDSGYTVASRTTSPLPQYSFPIRLSS